MLHCRWLGLAAAFAMGLSTICASVADAGKKATASGTKTNEGAKEALQKLQEFIGQWQDKASRQTVDWSWRFKGDDVWLAFEMKGSKHLKKGEIRFLPDKGTYQVTVVDKSDAKLDFVGDLKKNTLTVERKNPKTSDTEQLKINTAADGDRLIYTYLVKPDGRTLFNKQYQAGYTREGVTFGSEPGGKQPECVVTGGLGTMTVSFMGQTYYVCCSGCRDAFNENPAKIIAEYNAKKKKKTTR